MALFNKKKTQTPASAPTATAGNNSSDDFSDFSPDAMSAASDAAGSTPDTKKTRKAAAAREKKAASGRAIKAGVSIGLNIGSDSIKAIELQAKGNEMVITGMGMVPTPAESISNGVVMSVSALVGGIRDVMAQAGIKSKRVVTSVSGTGALVVRIIEVPKMSDGELEDNMKMDADRYIPFPPSEVIMDFTALRELPSDPDSANMEVLLAAAQREVIDLHVEVLQDAKLDPRSIDVEPLAAARALTHPLVTGVTLETEVDYNDVAAVLNIGASGTEISILRGDLLVFTRTVPTGGNALTQALVDTLGLAWSDAEQLKREMGDALPPGGDTSTPAAIDDDSDWNEDVSNNGANGDWGDFDTDEKAADESYASDANSFDEPIYDESADETVIDEPLGAQPINGAPANNGTSTTNSGDPFADDFYEQGPDNIRQSEPGEQHQQKEPGDSPFSFDDIDLPDEAEVKKLPTLEGDAIGTESIDGSLSTPEADEAAILPSTIPQNTDIFSAAPVSAPTSTPTAVTESGVESIEPENTSTEGTPVTNPFFDFGVVDEPEDKLPTLQDGSPVNFADFLTGEEDDFADLPTLRSDVTPSATVTSAFDFPSDSAAAPGLSTPLADDSDDFALPTFSGETLGTEQLAGFDGLDAQDEKLLPSETKSAPTANAFSFSFEDSLLATPEPTAPAAPIGADPFAEFMASAEPAVEAAPSTPIAPVAAPTPSTPAEEDFDLDSLFGDAAVNSADAAGDALDFDSGAFDEEFAMDDAAFGVGLAGAAVGEIDAKTLHDVLEPVLENLINEVRRSLEYHTTRYPDAAVRRVVVTGGGAKLTNMDAFFTEKLGIPTSIGNPVARMTLRAPNLPPGYADQNGPLFTVALGLAMRELMR